MVAYSLILGEHPPPMNYNKFLYMTTIKNRTTEHKEDINKHYTCSTNLLVSHIISFTISQSIAIVFYTLESNQFHSSHYMGAGALVISGYWRQKDDEGPVSFPGFLGAKLALIFAWLACCLWCQGGLSAVGFSRAEKYLRGLIETDICMHVCMWYLYFKNLLSTYIKDPVLPSFTGKYPYTD